MGERDSLKLALRAAHRKIADMQVAAVAPTDKPIYLIGEDWDVETLRRVVNGLAERCQGLCVAYSGSGGAYQYVLGGHGDIKTANAQMTASLNGRGGGDHRQCQGRVQATAEQIVTYWRDLGADDCFAEWSRWRRSSSMSRSRAGNGGANCRLLAGIERG